MVGNGVIAGEITVFGGTGIALSAIGAGGIAALGRGGLDTQWALSLERKTVMDGKSLSVIVGRVCWSYAV